MTNRLTILLVALGLSGCDDQFVKDNIDVWTCAVLPYWVADCASPEVHDKAIGVLEHGIVEASVDCSLPHWNWPWSSAPAYERIRRDILIDGSEILSRVQDQQPEELALLRPRVSEFCPRGQCSFSNFSDFDEYSGFVHTAEYTIDAGRLSVVISGQYVDSDEPPYENLSPLTVVDIPLSSCTGFNLEAFGD